jgi:hypothetical protein
MGYSAIFIGSTDTSGLPYKTEVKAAPSTLNEGRSRRATQRVNNQSAFTGQRRRPQGLVSSGGSAPRSARGKGVFKLADRLGDGPLDPTRCWLASSTTSDSVGGLRPALPAPLALAHGLGDGVSDEPGHVAGLNRIHLDLLRDLDRHPRREPHHVVRQTLFTPNKLSDGQYSMAVNIINRLEIRVVSTLPERLAAEMQLFFLDPCLPLVVPCG